jgi:hypothetical protein
MLKKLQDIEAVKKEKKLLKKKKILVESQLYQKNYEKRQEIMMQMKEAQDKIELMRKKKVDEKLKMKEK